MPPEQLARIQMMPVSFTNQLYGDEEAKRRARVDARFVNNAMMATLMGAAISDGLEDGQVVSGVGGQYNFVAQAFALEGARSILTLEATRQAGGKTHSNIRWNYGHETIPRHLRDIIVTEYGVADVRGKSDAETIAAMLAVTDSRFQDELAREAKDAGKLPKNFEIPRAHRENFPERIAHALEACARGRPAAVIPVRQRFYRGRAAADPGAAVAAGSAADAAASARIVVAGDDAAAGCREPANAWRGSASISPRPWPNAPIARWSARRWRGAE